MFSMTLMMKNEETGESREKTFKCDTKFALETLTASGERMGDIAYDLFNMAEENGILDPVEDDGDTYNGDVDNDINA